MTYRPLASFAWLVIATVRHRWSIEPVLAEDRGLDDPTLVPFLVLKQLSDRTNGTCQSAQDFLPMPKTGKEARQPSNHQCVPVSKAGTQPCKSSAQLELKLLSSALDTSQQGRGPGKQCALAANRVEFHRRKSRQHPVAHKQF